MTATYDISATTKAGRGVHIQALLDMMPHVASPDEFENMDGRTLEWLTSTIRKHEHEVAAFNEALGEAEHLIDLYAECVGTIEAAVKNLGGELGMNMFAHALGKLDGGK